jgi:hypothetical protein
MQLYHEALQKAGNDPGELTKLYASEIARRVVEAFDEVTEQPSLYKGDRDKLNMISRWTMEVIGGKFSDLCGGVDFAGQTAERKAKKGLAD